MSDTMQSELEKKAELEKKLGAEKKAELEKKPERLFRVKVAAGPEKGFWRCGRLWPRAQTEAVVTEAELEILSAERKLGVVVLGPAPANARPSPKPGETPKA